MTLQITNVKSAQYDSDGVAIFQVDCGDIATDTKIFNSGSRDAANDAILQAWLDAGNVVSEYVAPVIQQDATLGDLRRSDRSKEFSQTIDTMNNFWYDSLSDTEKAEIIAWRQLWLDYPTDLSATKPVRLSMFKPDLGF